MSKLVLTFQTFANYNVENPAEGNDYWKPKGLTEFVIEDISSSESLELVKEILPLIKLIKKDNVMTRYDFIDWRMESDDWIPSFEKYQMNDNETHIYFEPRLYQDKESNNWIRIDKTKSPKLTREIHYDLTLGKEVLRETY